MKTNRRASRLKELFDDYRDKNLSLQDSLKVFKKLFETNDINCAFEQSLDLAINLNLKSRYTVRDVVVLPNQVKEPGKKILVFAKGSKAEEAEQAGADYVGTKEYIDKIKSGWFEFDVILATPDMMKEVAQISAVLGKKGLMPNPKVGTVTFDLAYVIKEIRRGRHEYRSDKNGIVHFKIAKLGMPQQEIEENIRYFYSELLKKRPADVKGAFVKSVHLNATMSPALSLIPHSLVS